MHAILDWIEKHPGTAGWLQAVGAIIAVVVAIAVPYRLQRSIVRRDETERRLKGRSLVVAIYPEILKLQGDVDRLLAFFDAEVEDQQGVRVEALTIGVPDILGGSLDRLYLLGEDAAVPLTQLIAVIKRTDELVAKSVMPTPAGIQPYGGPQSLVASATVKSFRTRWATAKQLLDEAQRALGPLPD